MNDEKYMRLALELAKATIGQTLPNPSVGAIIVKNNQIVGLGSHVEAGQAHAEVHALNMAGDKARGATLYVTLEPCAHFGKTPPCVEAIIKAGIAKVIIATLDYNPVVCGRGVSKLEEFGIIVEVGLLEIQARQINREFFYSILHKLPYISLKVGLSLDCKLATKTGESKWITNEEARNDAHYYRHASDAILVGIGSILADNPALTSRIAGGSKNPIRIVLDTNLRTPIMSQIVVDNQAQTLIVCGSQVNTIQIDKFSKYPQVTIIQMDEPIINLRVLLQKLYKWGITSILVEGGNTVCSSFLEHKLINRLIMYVSPILIGGLDAPTLFAGFGVANLADAMHLKFESVEYVGENIKIIANVEDSCLQE